MDGVQPIGVGEKGVATGTPDSGNGEDFVMGNSQSLNGVIQALMNAEVAASRAPGGQFVGTDVKDPRPFDLPHRFSENTTACLH